MSEILLTGRLIKVRWDTGATPVPDSKNHLAKQLKSRTNEFEVREKWWSKWCWQTSLQIWLSWIINERSDFTRSLSRIWLTKLHKHIFGRVQSDGVKVLSHQDFNWSFVPVLWDILWPIVRLQKKKGPVRRTRTSTVLYKSLHYFTPSAFNLTFTVTYRLEKVGTVCVCSTFAVPSTTSWHSCRSESMVSSSESLAYFFPVSILMMRIVGASSLDTAK